MHIASPGVPTNISMSSYFCPPIFQGSSLVPLDQLEPQVLGWLQESIQEGQHFLSTERAYSDLDIAIDSVMGKVFAESAKTMPEWKSKIFVNIVKRDIREIVAILSNIRLTPLYEPNTTQDQNLKDQARIINALNTDWYWRTGVDRKLKQVMQWAAVGGTGYLCPYWNPNWNNTGTGQIDMKVLGPTDFLPIQMSRDNNIQTAYAGIIIDEMPLHRAMQFWPTKAAYLIPDRQDSAIKSARSSGFTEVFSSIWSKLRPDQSKRIVRRNMVDIFYAYIDDFSVNKTGAEVSMGEGPWQYTVPYIGQQILQGYDPSGNAISKRADAMDAKLYPYKRLVIASRTAILYDGPSYWWHGQIPAVKFTVDDWIWDYLGYSMIRDSLSIQTSANEIRRGIEDAIRVGLDPPMQIDSNSVAQSTAEEFSLRKPGAKLRGNLSAGDFAKPVVNPGAYRLDAWHPQYVQSLEEEASNILGLPGLKALQQAGQVPSGDSIEKFFAQAGALVTDISRSMDASILKMASLNLSLYFEFCDTKRRLTVLGLDGITPEDFDFDPGTLIPQNLPNEKADINGIYSSSRSERAKYHLMNFRTTITPTSMHQITHIQRKLLFMQASKVNPFLVSVETLAKQLDIPNWGHLDGDTELEKIISMLKLQEQLGLKTAFDQGMLQLLLQAMAQGASPMGQAAGGIQQLLQNLNTPSGGQEGRPPSWQKAPHMELRDDDTRATVVTS